MNHSELEKYKMAVIGLGYVGLPLAVEFANHFSVVGFDTNSERIRQLRSGHDITSEVDDKKIGSSDHLSFTDKPKDLSKCNVYIITVPTPITVDKIPDLRALLRATTTVGKLLKRGDLVIYESTVYPGCTEEDCVPVLEKISSLRFNKDFYCGYSPERINPGDKKHTIRDIRKVTSGSTPKIGKIVNRLYNQIISAGTYLAPSMKVAEAAKVIENSQRDINIAFVNELSIIFHRMGIDTAAVIKAAATKWNFIDFKPGLVGGHCIGVDPYYLAAKSKQFGYHPEILLAGRRLNDSMGQEIGVRIIKLMLKSDLDIKDSKILILGITFKENCPDIRNSKVVDLIKELRDFGCNFDIYDPLANATEVSEEYGEKIIPAIAMDDRDLAYDVVVAAVAHNQFKELEYDRFTNPKTIFYDLKGIFPEEKVTQRL